MAEKIKKTSDNRLLVAGCKGQVTSQQVCKNFMVSMQRQNNMQAADLVTPWVSS